MPRVTTEALTLRRTPYGETSQVAVFLTATHGRQSLIAKGVHRPKSRKGGGLDLLDHSLVTWTSKRGSRALPQLIERKVREHHPAMRRRSDLLAAGSWLVELLLGLVADGQHVPGVFRLSLAYLEALDLCPAPDAVAPAAFALQGGLLRLTGFEPTLDRCVSCQRRPEAHHLLRCDPVRGGVVCGACREGDDHSFALSARAAAVARALAGRDPRSAVELTLPPAVESQIRHYHERILVHLLERPPRCRLPAAPAA